MHKKFLLFSTILVMLFSASCQKGGKSLADIKDATPADTMMYYFGEMQAYNYLQDAETDTMLRSDNSKAEFIKGFRTALRLDDDNQAYNKGLQLGLRLAIRLREFEKRYGKDFSEAVLAESLENALYRDSINIAEAQKGYYLVKDRYDYNTAQSEIGAAKENLAAHGKAQGYEMLSDTLYFKEVVPGYKGGVHFKKGDRLAVELTASTIDGKEIVARQFPDSLTLGEGRVPPVVREAIYTMTNGETCKFMTTARTLFGKRYSVYKLPYDEPVVFTVKAYR